MSSTSGKWLFATRLRVVLCISPSIITVELHRAGTSSRIAEEWDVMAGV